MTATRAQIRSEDCQPVSDHPLTASCGIFSQDNLAKAKLYFLYSEPTRGSIAEKSPGCLADAGDLALISQFTEADTADAVVAQIGVGTAADLAAVVLAGGELSRGLLLKDH